VVRYEWNAQHLEVKRSNFDGRGQPWPHKGCFSLDTLHDQYRQAVRQTCRNAEGKPVLSTDNVSATTWRYDARGLLVETRYLDVQGELIDARRGYARKEHHYDARGLESRSRHFKADGTELELPRYSVLWVRPPLSDAFWPAPSRARALLDVEAAHRDLLAGLPWHAALVRYGDEKVYAASPGDSGYLNLATLWPALRVVLEPLTVGQYSRVVEIPYGVAIYQRTE
jgi:YD repeat-containing protein